MDHRPAKLLPDRLLDEYLLASARLGDRAAQEQLVKRWQPKLLAHAIRLTGESEGARDATQAAWAQILRSLGKLRDDRAFAAWAYRITSRACAREIGKSASQRRLKQAYASEPRDESTEPQEPSQMARLQQAIRQLPAGERAAIALYHFEEMRVAEVAVALDIPAGTVKTRLMNARRKLRKILEGDDHE